MEIKHENCPICQGLMNQINILAFLNREWLSGGWYCRDCDLEFTEDLTIALRTDEEGSISDNINLITSKRWEILNWIRKV